MICWFTNKIRTNHPPRATKGRYKCLVTGSLGTGFLKSFLLTVLLGFLGPTNLVWGIGKKTVFQLATSY